RSRRPPSSRGRGPGRARGARPRGSLRRRRCVEARRRRAPGAAATRAALPRPRPRRARRGPSRRDRARRRTPIACANPTVVRPWHGVSREERAAGGSPGPGFAPARGGGYPRRVAEAASMTEGIALTLGPGAGWRHLGSTPEKAPVEVVLRSFDRPVLF